MKTDQPKCVCPDFCFPSIGDKSRKRGEFVTLQMHSLEAGRNKPNNEGRPTYQRVVVWSDGATAGC